MSRLRKALALAVVLLPAATLPSYSQTTGSVPQGHWAYEAVQDLASKGLIKGYPPSGAFFGGRTVTRYEMAVIIQRVIARVDEMLDKKADKGATPATTEGVKPEQLDEVRKLVDDFKVELTVIGTDLKQVKDDLGALKDDVETVKTDVAAVKEQATKAGEDAAAAKTSADEAASGVSSTIDAINEQAGRIDKLQSGKVDAGFGKIKVGGALQLWFQGAQNSPLTGIDGFRIRRVEVKLSGNINKKAYWGLMFDPSKSPALSTSSTSGNLTAAGPDQTKNILQDAIVGWVLCPSLALEIGQQKIPLGMEGTRSSSQLLTVERSLANNLPVNRGRYSDIRELGAMFRYASASTDAQLAVMNDGGNLQNQTDNNNNKEIIAHAVYKGIRHFTVGASILSSGGVLLNANTQNKKPSPTLRNRWGVEATAVYGQHRFESEYFEGRDGTANSAGTVTSYRTPFQGMYLLYAYKLNPTWEFIARGEYYNVNKNLHGAARQYEYDGLLGINYYLAGHNAKIQANFVRKNINGPANSDLGVDRNQILVNFQQAF